MIYHEVHCLSQVDPQRIAKTGRWRLEHCKTQMNQKVDLSNEDHCGTCGQYAKEKMELKEPNVEK